MGEETSKVDLIFKQAHELADLNKRLGRKPTARQYEHFKQKLLDEGIYGRERELADILNF